MWPGGGPRPERIPRTAEEQMLTKARAARKIQTIIPGALVHDIAAAAQRALSVIFSQTSPLIWSGNLTLGEPLEGYTLLSKSASYANISS